MTAEKEQKPDGLKEQIEALAISYARSNFLLRPELTDNEVKIVIQNATKAGAAAGIALVLAEMEEFQYQYIMHNAMTPYDGNLHPTYAEGMQRMNNHIKQFTNSVTEVERSEDI